MGEAFTLTHGLSSSGGNELLLPVEGSEHLRGLFTSEDSAQRQVYSFSDGLSTFFVTIGYFCKTLHTNKKTLHQISKTL